MSRKNKRQSKWTIGRMAKRSNNWERQNKDSFRENRNKTRYMSKKSAKGLRDLVFICRSINRAVYTGKKRKALSGLNNWVVTMFFFILIKWLLFFQSLRTSSYERFNLHFISSPGLDHVSRTISVHMAQDDSTYRGRNGIGCFHVSP